MRLLRDINRNLIDSFLIKINNKDCNMEKNSFTQTEKTKPIEEVIDYLVQLKILLQEQNKEMILMKTEITKMKASISILNDNLREQNEIQKKGWFA